MFASLPTCWLVAIELKTANEYHVAIKAPIQLTELLNGHVASPKVSAMAQQRCCTYRNRWESRFGHSDGSQVAIEGRVHY